MKVKIEIVITKIINAVAGCTYFSAMQKFRTSNQAISKNNYLIIYKKVSIFLKSWRNLECFMISTLFNPLALKKLLYFIEIFAKAFYNCELWWNGEQLQSKIMGKKVSEKFKQLLLFSIVVFIWKNLTLTAIFRVFLMKTVLLHPYCHMYGVSLKPIIS